MANVNSLLMSILMGMGGGQQAQANPASPGPPVPTPRPAMPPQRNVPRPTPRPTLPGGSFAPNRQTMPPAPMPAPQQQDGRGNPLMALLSGGAAGGDWRQMIRAAGAGMRNMGPTGGDPFLAFGQGFGGATGHYDAKDASAAEAARLAEETAYDRSQDAYSREKDAADLDLRRAAEARQAKRAEMENQKTAAELTRLARQNGLTVNQMLEIERIAQAAGESEYNSAKRREVVDQERKRLIEQFQDGDTTRSGLSGGDGGGLSAPEVGTIEDDYEFLGGDPADPKNWKPVN